MPASSNSAGRRQRRGVETVGLHVKVPSPARDLANGAASGMGITMGRYIEILITRDVRDDRGLPLWATADVDLTKTIPMPLTRGDVAA